MVDVRVGKATTCAWALGALACACGFDASGIGTSAGSLQSDGSGGATSSEASAGTTDAASTTADESTMRLDTTESIGDGPVMLVLEEAPAFDFFDVALGSIDAHEFVLRNDGTGAAIDVGAVIEGASFAWSGGAYPGTTGTCTDTLQGGESCVLVVACAPAQWGAATGVLALHYDDPQVGPGAIEVSLAARGIGETANLLVNGDAEQGGTPPIGWALTDGGGDGWQSTSEVVYAGAFAFFAGPAAGQTLSRLRQSVDVDQWARLIDSEALSFRVRAVTRAKKGGDDPHEVRLRFFDASSEVLAELKSPQHDGAQWTGVDIAMPAPVGTRLVQVQLRCDREVGMVCSAYFDDVSLVASYPSE